MRIYLKVKPAFNRIFVCFGKYKGFTFKERLWFKLTGLDSLFWKSRKFDV